MDKINTQVGIIGAGPAGLLLGQMLYNYGIDSVIIEKESRNTILTRVRAGVIEAKAVETFVEHGVGERLLKERMIHKGVRFNYEGKSVLIDTEQLLGHGITLYGQRFISRDMIEIREANQQLILFEAEALRLEDLESNQPKIYYAHHGEEKLITCDFIAGCDSYEGIGQASIPSKLKKPQKYLYPYGWLAILAEAPPLFREVVYAHHPTGFALNSMRSLSLSRLYLQCKPQEDPSEWPDERIWEQLDLRLGHKLNRGKILSKNVTPMRNEHDETMNFGRLFLAGDAAHIVPPTGAKGLNLAVGDVRVLSKGLQDFYRTNDTNILDNYASICLDRILKVQRFSWWMTTTFHIDPNQGPFNLSMQLATLNYVCSSEAGAKAFAENYLGLPYAY